MIVKASLFRSNLFSEWERYSAKSSACHVICHISINSLFNPCRIEDHKESICIDRVPCFTFVQLNIGYNVGIFLL